jgi:hypothetical protein
MNFKAASVQLYRHSNRHAAIRVIRSFASQNCGFTAEPAMNAINKHKLGCGSGFHHAGADRA